MKYCFILLSVLYFQASEAQFLGGSKDGYNSAIELSSINIYAGGQKDGYAQSFNSASTSIYSGGAKDGYVQEEWQSNTSIYTGGANDGYHAQEVNSSISIYTGGSKDGYAKTDTIANLIWTGTVGTGWNVDENWNLGFYPRLRHGAIIPAGLTNYPKVNAGLLTVGKDLNGGVYYCKGIHLAAGAEMTLRVNATLENYGLINIYGNFISLSTQPEAIKIINPGQLIIRSGGTFDW